MTATLEPTTSAEPGTVAEAVTITVSQKQAAYIKRFADGLGISENELLTQALDALAAQIEREEDDRAILNEISRLAEGNDVQRRNPTPAPTIDPAEITLILPVPLKSFRRYRISSRTFSLRSMLTRNR